MQTSRMSWPPRLRASGHPLDDAPLRALDALDHKSFLPQPVEWLAQEVIRYKPNRKWIQDALHESHRARWAAHVFEEQESAAGAEDALYFSHGENVIRNRAERQRRDHAVERAVRQGEGLRVAEAQVHDDPELARALTRVLEHRGRDVESDELHPAAIVAEIPPRADADLENVALRLRADPLATARKQQALKERDLAVVAPRRLLIEPTDPFGLTAIKSCHGLILRPPPSRPHTMRHLLLAALVASLLRCSSPRSCILRPGVATSMRSLSPRSSWALRSARSGGRTRAALCMRRGTRCS